MPALGMAQETGTLIQWLKSPGDSVAKGEPLMEVETDKATVEIEAPANGILASVTAQAGDVIPVGQRIALILAPGEAERALPTKPTATSSSPSDATLTRVPATPVAAHLAAEHNLDLSQIKPHGGQIRKEDVLAFLKEEGSSLKDESKETVAIHPSRLLASPKAKRLAQE